MHGDSEESMLATLAMMREEFGGAEGYVKKLCGLSNEDVERIQKNMVAEGEPIF